MYVCICNNALWFSNWYVSWQKKSLFSPQCMPIPTMMLVSLPTPCCWSEENHAPTNLYQRASAAVENALPSRQHSQLGLMKRRRYRAGIKLPRNSKPKTWSGNQHVKGQIQTFRVAGAKTSDHLSSRPTLVPGRHPIPFVYFATQNICSFHLWLLQEQNIPEMFSPLPCMMLPWAH